MGSEIRVLDLFSGIGGFSLGLEWAGPFRTVAFCEQDKFCQQVLAKHWPDVPCFDDVRTLNAETLADATSQRCRSGEDIEREGPAHQQNEPRPGVRSELGGCRESAGTVGSHIAVPTVDLICGGYPCQPFSQAGKREGTDDDRHLWPEMHRIVASVRPRWVIAENVAGHISMGLDSVLSDLEGEGYTCWPLIIPACAVDAPHRRDRVWIVAHDQSVGRGARRAGRPDTGSAGQRKQAFQAMANADITGREQQRRPKPIGQEHATAQRGSRWLPEPGVGRVAHGIPRRVDRLRGLGNAVVPQVVAEIGKAIYKFDTNM